MRQAGISPLEFGQVDGRGSRVRVPVAQKQALVLLRLPLVPHGAGGGREEEKMKTAILQLFVATKTRVT
jgi:hypothetical protein